MTACSRPRGDGPRRLRSSLLLALILSLAPALLGASCDIVSAKQESDQEYQRRIMRGSVLGIINSERDAWADEEGAALSLVRDADRLNEMLESILPGAIEAALKTLMRESGLSVGGAAVGTINLPDADDPE